MPELPRAPCDKILRRNGAERVSADAAEEFAEVLEDVASEIAQEAADLAAHAGRNTVMIEDMKMARRKHK